MSDAQFLFAVLQAIEKLRDTVLNLRTATDDMSPGCGFAGREAPLSPWQSLYKTAVVLRQPSYLKYPRTLIAQMCQETAQSRITETNERIREAVSRAFTERRLLMLCTYCGQEIDPNDCRVIQQFSTSALVISSDRRAHFLIEPKSKAVQVITEEPHKSDRHSRQ